MKLLAELQDVIGMKRFFTDVGWRTEAGGITFLEVKFKFKSEDELRNFLKLIQR